MENASANNLRAAMFSLILNGAGSLLLLYVAWRSAGVPWIRRRVRTQHFAALTVGLWLLYLAGVQVHDATQGPA